MITVLSFSALGGLYPSSLRAGTRPLGESSRSSAGFLYGSTSSTSDVSNACMCRSQHAQHTGAEELKCAAKTGVSLTVLRCMR